jgi:hypothetical protein
MKNSFSLVFHPSLAVQYARNGVNISPAEVYCLINTFNWFLKGFYRLIMLYNGRWPIRIVYGLVYAVNCLVTPAYLNFITSKLLADLWYCKFITGFLWSTAALSDSPIIGKPIFY